MSEESYISTASDNAARAALLPTKPSEDVSHLLGKIEPLGGPEEAEDYGPCEQTEWVVEVSWKDAIPKKAQTLGDLFKQGIWREDDEPTLYGKDSTSGKWTFLISSDGPKEVTSLKVAWPYVAERAWEGFSFWKALPPADVADSDEFEERFAAIQKACASLPGAVIRTDVNARSAAKRAQHLTNLHERFGPAVTLRLKAPFLRKFDGKEIWDVMLCLGLRWGDLDCFHWKNESSYGYEDHFTVATSTGCGYFLPEEIAAGKLKVKDLEFLSSVLGSANPEQVFRAMLAAARYAQSRLGGSIEGRVGETVDLEALPEAIRKEIETWRAEGFIPGSKAALRLW